MLDISEITPIFILMVFSWHIDGIKNDQLRKEFENTIHIVFNIRDKKIEEFLKYFRMAIDYTYEMNDPLLTRHFLFKAIEEVNDDLIKNKKPYTVDFGYETAKHFINETEAYWQKQGFYNDDGTLNLFRLGRHM